MDLFYACCRSFFFGGLLCLFGQLLIDRSRLSPGRILTLYVVSGLILSALGIYEPLAELMGAGATVPLTGFGHNLAKGVREAVAQKGLLGAFTGGMTAAAGGITAAISAALLVSFVFRSKDKG